MLPLTEFFLKIIYLIARIRYNSRILVSLNINPKFYPKNWCIINYYILKIQQVITYKPPKIIRGTYIVIHN